MIICEHLPIHKGFLCSKCVLASSMTLYICSFCPRRCLYIYIYLMCLYVYPYVNNITYMQMTEDSFQESFFGTMQFSGIEHLYHQVLQEICYLLTFLIPRSLFFLTYNVSFSLALFFPVKFLICSVDYPRTHWVDRIITYRYTCLVSCVLGEKLCNLTNGFICPYVIPQSNIYKELFY